MQKQKVAALAGTTAFLIAPGTVSAVIPWLISDWKMQPPFFGLGALRIVGWLLIALGAAVLLESFFRFAVEGLGTPAPIAPTAHLVVRGFYRYVRNPMYIALIAIVLGQALLFGNLLLIVYAVVVWAAAHAFVRYYEEPTLHKRHGKEYDAYCARVPRWLRTRR